MTNRMIAAAVLAIFLTGVLAPPPAIASTPNNPSSLLQRATRTKHVARTFPVNGREVRLDGRAMDLRVEPTSGDQATIEVDLEYWSRSEEWMDLVASEFDVEVAERSRVIEVSAGRVPEQNKGWWNRVFGADREVSWALSVVLRVPNGTALRLENRYGDIDVDGVGGALEIDNASGEVTVRDSGATTISNSYGPIDVQQVDGELRIRGNSAEVNVVGVRGRADLETSYGEMNVANVVGSLLAVASSGELRVTNVTERAELTNSYGAAEIRDVGALRLRASSSEVIVVGVRGSASVESSYAAMVVEDVQGALDIDNPSGSVTVSGADGDVAVHNSYAPVRVSDIAGNLNVDSSSAAVTARNIAGNVEISTSYAGTTVRNVGGQVRIRNQSGRVAVTDLVGAALTAEHSITTSYANVEVEWPRSAPLAIDAECTYGRISSDFDGNLDEQSSSTHRFTSDATGGGRFTLVVKSGSISLLQR